MISGGILLTKPIGCFLGLLILSYFFLFHGLSKIVEPVKGEATDFESLAFSTTVRNDNRI